MGHLWANQFMMIITWLQNTNEIIKQVKNDTIKIFHYYFKSWLFLRPRTILSSGQFSSLQPLNHARPLWPHGLQHARIPSLSPPPGAWSNSCWWIQWSHPTKSSSVIPFSSFLQPFPASRSFQITQLFASGGQGIGVSASASVLPMSIQDWFPLGLTSLTSLQSKGLSRVFPSTTVWKDELFSTQLSL